MMTGAKDPRTLDVFVNIHVADPERTGPVYAQVFGLEPLLGMTKFNDSAVCRSEWTEWECEIPEGLVTVRFVKKGTDMGQFPAKEFARLVNADLAGARQRAIEAGFTIVSEIESVDSELSIMRLLDAEGNRIVLGNRSLWVRNDQA